MKRYIYNQLLEWKNKEERDYKAAEVFDKVGMQ